jgi:hypothetical protein
MPLRVRFHQQHDIGVGSVHIERETDKRGQDKHTNREF